MYISIFLGSPYHGILLWSFNSQGCSGSVSSDMSIPVQVPYHWGLLEKPRHPVCTSLPLILEAVVCPGFFPVL